MHVHGARCRPERKQSPVCRDAARGAAACQARGGIARAQLRRINARETPRRFLEACFGSCTRISRMLGPGKSFSQCPSTYFKPSFLDFNAAPCHVLSIFCRALPELVSARPTAAPPRRCTPHEPRGSQDPRRPKPPHRHRRRIPAFGAPPTPTAPCRTRAPRRPARPRRTPLGRARRYMRSHVTEWHFTK